MYNETGIDYLRCISRTPQDIEDIVSNKLLPLYEGVTHDELYSDFVFFLKDLQKMGFLLIGENPQVIDIEESTIKKRTKSFV